MQNFVYYVFIWHPVIALKKEAWLGAQSMFLRTNRESESRCPSFGLGELHLPTESGIVRPKEDSDSLGRKSGDPFSEVKPEAPFSRIILIILAGVRLIVAFDPLCTRCVTFRPPRPLPCGLDCCRQSGSLIEHHLRGSKD